MGEWLIPFKGRHDTGPYVTNFVWRDGPFYVMDNHRSALWCWEQEFKPGKSYNYYHIDAHYDTLAFEEPWRAAWPENFPSLTLDEYLQVPMPGKPGEFLFRYDNYLTLFYELHPTVFERSYFHTHQIGDKPRIPGNFDVWHTFHFTSWASALRDAGDWVVNLDLDFYFYLTGAYEMKSLFSEEYLVDTIAPLAEAWKAGKIDILTLCLTPEYCGGWKNAEPLTYRICDALGVNFRLPA